MSEFPRTAEIPFDSERKRMVTIHRTADGSSGLVATKGAIEATIDAIEQVATRAGRPST